MSVNRDIENDWDWFQPFSNGLLDGDEVIVVRTENGRRQAIRADIQEAINKAQSGGWVYQSDSTHTSGSPQSITGGTRTLFSVDGLGGTTSEAFATTLPDDVWSANTINPETIGEVYAFRMDLVIVPTVVASDAYMAVQLDIGSGSEINILERRIGLQKGNGVEHRSSVGSEFFCLSTFNANGGKFYITPSINVNVYSNAIFLQRTFKP